MIRILCLPLLAMALFSCTHSVHMVNTSELPQAGRVKRMKAVPIEAQAEQKVILSFAFETDYVEQAWARLQQKCSGGDIRSIMTRYSSSHGFLSWTNTIKMKAMCFRQ